MSFVKELGGLAFIGIMGLLAVRGDAKANELVMSGFGYFLSRSWPKPPQVGAIAAATLVTLAFMHLSACSSQQGVVAQYGAEQAACVEIAKTREEADKCRAAVKARFADAGSDASIVDAGGQ